MITVYGLPNNLVLPRTSSDLPNRYATHINRLYSRYTKQFVLSVVVILASCSKSASLDSSVDDLIFKTLSGEQISMQSRPGPVLVNFWATDCAICLQEMPEIAELYNDYHDKGFDVIAVAMPYDAPNQVLEMAEHEGWPFPVALDIQGEALASFATVKGTPTSYLIDVEGKLIKRYVGAISMNHIRKQLDALLGLG